MWIHNLSLFDSKFLYKSNSIFYILDGFIYIYNSGTRTTFWCPTVNGHFKCVYSILPVLAQNSELALRDFIKGNKSSNLKLKKQGQK